METKLKVKTESLAERCEICHQDDCFDPKTGSCTRCVAVTSTLAQTEKQLYIERRKWPSPVLRNLCWENSALPLERRFTTIIKSTFFITFIIAVIYSPSFTLFFSAVALFLWLFFKSLHNVSSTARSYTTMKDDKTYLNHILECIRRIEENTATGYDQFIASHTSQDAVLRNLQTISESTQRLSYKSKAIRSEIEWLRISAFGNVLVRNYLDIDLDMIWQFVERDVPGLKEAVSDILNKIS